MEKTISLEMTSEEAAKLSALLEMCITKMDEAHGQMAKDQEDIERLRAKTQAKLELMERRQQEGNDLVF